MKACLFVISSLIAATLSGCSALSGSGTYLDSPAAKLQTMLRNQPDSIFKQLVVTESSGILQVNGFVKSFREKRAVEELVTRQAVMDDLNFDGRVVSRVGLYADYDCHAVDECIAHDECSTDAFAVSESSGECY